MNLRPQPRKGIKINRIDWETFKNWLFKEYKPVTAGDRLRYARKYAECLINRDFSGLKLFTPDKCNHVLKGLAALSKYLGLYDEFKQLIKNYGLKWAGRNSDDLIIDRLVKTANPHEVYDWIRQVKGEIPELNDFMDFITVTGLRFVEAVNSYNLIVELAGQERLNDYYKPEKEVLEHFRFKDILIRRTKNLITNML